MNRSLRLWIAIATAAAVGGLSAYAFLSVHARAPDVSAPAIALVPTRGAAVSSPAPGADSAVSYPVAAEHPVGIASYRDAVARAGPSVVTVHSAYTSKGPLPLGPTVLVKGLGSGVIVDSGGYIVTNSHVIEGASQLAVALPDGTLHLTRVIGADPGSDIALLKIDVEGLRPITPADINEVAVGDVVLAVGNPLGVGQTGTQGSVSAIMRKGMNPVENFIQTDASINPGNSGGALIDTAGSLAGINVAILSHIGAEPGAPVAIDIVRNGKRATIDVQLASVPTQQTAR